MTIDEVAEIYLKDIYDNKSVVGMNRPIGRVTIYFDSDELILHMQGKKLGKNAYAVIETSLGACTNYSEEPENFLELAERMKDV